MRDRKKRNIIIGALCCLLVFMGIGYAILSQTLNISGIANMKGNWNVKITNMELLSENKTGRAVEVSHSFTDTTATFTADLYMPGDSIEYRVIVENQGNIDALLKSITPTTTNRSEGIKFSHSEIDNTILTAGKKITFTMKVEFLEDATSIPKVDNVKYNLELVYVQYNGGEYTPAVETTGDDCFDVSENGTLRYYNHACGIDNVVVPAKVNGIPIKRVSAYAFAEPVLLLGEDESGAKLGFFTKEQYEKNKTEFDEHVTAYFKGSAEFASFTPQTLEEFLSNEQSEKFRVYKDEYNIIKIEINETNYNMIGYYNSSSNGGYWICNDLDTYNLFREYLRSKDPAKEVGITEETYYEYSNYEFNVENPKSGYTSKYPTNFLNTYIKGSLPSEFEYSYNIGYNVMVFGEPNSKIKKVDLSNAIYIEGRGNSPYAFVYVSEIVFPPNIEFGCIDSEKITFTKDTKLKVFCSGSSSTSVSIPDSVVSIPGIAFNYKHTLSSINFGSNSKLVAIYNGTGDDSNNGGAFEATGLTSITLPKSLQYIGGATFDGSKLQTVTFAEGSKLKYIGGIAFRENQLTNTGLGKLPSSLTSLAANAFSNNPSLTQITLTSPTDIEGWANGSTVDGKTVVYER